jgi:hypothetical protein
MSHRNSAVTHSAPPFTGLEVWLIGTPAELDAAAHALADLGHVRHHAHRTALAGRDIGRYRTYAWIYVAAALPAPACPHAQTPTLPDLAA